MISDKHSAVSFSLDRNSDGWMGGGNCDTSHQMGPFCCRIYRAMNDVMMRLRFGSEMCDSPS
jgi:hypothetical protein